MKVITANLLNRFWTNGVKPIKTAVGTISSLTTAAKTNLVAAINEVKAKADSNATAITNVNNNLAVSGIVLTSGVVTFFSNQSWKWGRIVSLHIGFTANYALTADTTMIILPENIRPKTSFFTPLFGFSNNIVGLAEVKDSGNIILKLNGLATNVNAILNSTYIL